MSLNNYNITASILKLVCFLLITMNLCSCDDTASDGKVTPTDTKQVAKTDSSKWEYRVDVDEMTSEKTRFATLDADRKLYFNNTRNCPVFPQIGIEKDKEGTRVWVAAASLGSSTCNGVFKSYNNEANLEVKFDDGEVMTFKGTTPDGEDKYYVLLNKANLFITKLKKSNKVRIRATFVKFQPAVIRSTRIPIGSTKMDRTRSEVTEGKHFFEQEIIEFDTKGLKWDSDTNKKVKSRRAKPNAAKKG